MILCHECRKPIEIPVEYGLRTPLRGYHLCDDCILLLDHVSDTTTASHQFFSSSFGS